MAGPRGLACTIAFVLLWSPVAGASGIIEGGVELAPVGICGATLYHVADEATGAADSSDGTSPTYQGGTVGPWKTLQKPAGGGATVVGGDIVQVHNGTYNGTV
ncbi:MAG TPA: hypothetical protein VI893_09965, partial [Thermoplasmata archaeon]|nr:hypothetical protein [Thermoplasmata archaeon]